METGARIVAAGTMANARWVRILPRILRSRLDGRVGLQAVLGNGGWLILDKVLRMGVGLLVGVWIIRYLGPQQLGTLNYAAAFAGLFGAIAALGLDRIVVQELVRDPERRAEILGTAFALRLIAGLLVLVIATVAISKVRPGDTLALWLVAICGAGFAFQSAAVIDFFFQARMQAKYAVIAANLAFIVVTLAKIVLLMTSASLMAFAWAGLAETALAAVFLVVAYGRAQYGIRAWRFSTHVAGKLLRYSWPLMLSGVAVMVYMRIDQVMIGEMLGDTEVGLFSAAVKISELWYFIPMAIVSSVVPVIVRSKENDEVVYKARLQALLAAVIWLGIAVATVITIARYPIVQLLFGQAYAQSADVLAIHVWGGVFVTMGLASGIWFTVENLQIYSFYRTLCGCMLNISLNLVLIPRYGIEGAAVATVAAQFFAALLFDASNSKTRPVFWMKIRSLNPLLLVRLAKGVS